MAISGEPRCRMSPFAEISESAGAISKEFQGAVLMQKESIFIHLFKRGLAVKIVPPSFNHI